MSKVGEESLLKSLLSEHGPGCWQSDALLDLVEERDRLAELVEADRGAMQDGLARQINRVIGKWGSIHWTCSETEGHVEATDSRGVHTFSAQLGAEEVGEFVAGLVRILEKEQA